MMRRFCGDENLTKGGPSKFPDKVPVLPTSGAMPVVLATWVRPRLGEALRWLCYQRPLPE